MICLKWTISQAMEKIGIATTQNILKMQKCFKLRENKKPRL